MENFTICVIYKAKEKGAREAFLCELTEKGIVDLIRNENGCFAYDYYFSNEDEKTLVLYEKWESPAHQKVHMTQPHMKTAMEIKSKYIESVQLKRVDISDL